jgi:epoxyqueuosine reductase
MCTRSAGSKGDHKMQTRPLTDRARDLARRLGADLFGVAPVQRYHEAGAPLHMSPDGLLPGATCAVVIAIHHPDAAIGFGGEPDPQTQGPYAIQGRMNEKLEHIMFHLADFLQREGHRVLGLPATNVWRFRGRPEEDNPFLPDISNIHAAWAAGLGEIGWSGLLLSPQYGPRQRFCCLVTDAPLEPSPMYSGDSLCDRCDLCVKHCPTNAFEEETAGEVVLSAAGSTVRYCKKSKWRCSWAEHFALDLDLPKPEVITEEVLLEQLAAHGVRGGEMGCCLRFCMVPQRRYFDRDYSRAPRRKRDAPSDGSLVRATQAAGTLLLNHGASKWATVAARDLGERGADLTARLPDGQAAVAFSVFAPEAAGPVVRGAAASWRDFMELDLARGLEAEGYAAMPRSGIDTAVVAQAAGLEAEGPDLLGCVLTSAPFQTTAPQHAPPPDRPAESDLMQALDEQLRACGAHLLWAVEARAVQELVPALREVLDEKHLRVHVRDAGPTHGPVKPVAQPRDLPIIKGPLDHLPEAQSVLVIGLHHPAENITLAGDPPANAIGPYAFSTYQVARELEYLAWRVVALLDAWGYRAMAVRDLCGTGGQVITPRGVQPDAFCSRFAAAACGLAKIGWHGAPITPEFGVTQRFISVLTDAPLKATAAAPLADPCEGCDRPCVTACPVAAIPQDDSVELRVGSSVERFVRLDRLRCDWASKYGLVADEGPGAMGQTTDIPPPHGDITTEQIAHAMAQKDPVQKHFTCIVERCLQACQRRLEAT